MIHSKGKTRALQGCPPGPHACLNGNGGNAPPDTAACHVWQRHGRSLDRLVQRFIAETGACSSRS